MNNGFCLSRYNISLFPSSYMYLQLHLGQLASRGSSQVQRQGLEENCRILFPRRISRQGSVPSTLANDLQTQINQRPLDPGGIRSMIFALLATLLYFTGILVRTYLPFLFLVIVTCVLVPVLASDFTRVLPCSFSVNQ